MKNNVKLRPLNINDLQGMQEWMTDKECKKWFQFPEEYALAENIEKFIHNASIEIKNGESIHWAISSLEGEYLGTVSLKDVDVKVGKAEYAIALRNKVRGKGIGEQATKLILDKAFTEYKLTRVFLNVISDNERAIHMYEKCGFSYEGEFRNHIFTKDRICSIKWYAMLKDEYELKIKKDSEK